MTAIKSLTPRQSFIKRCFDLLIACPLIIIAAPVVLVFCIAVILETRGGAFYIQTRLGKNARPYKFYKMRTMFTGTGDYATHLVGTDQITRVGRLLRKTKIDELPQLWNVIIGDMSMVGPRPGLPSQNNLTAIRHEHGIFDILPGITGLAQVNGIDMSQQEILAKADSEYIHRQNLCLDFRIVVSTFSPLKTPLLGTTKSDA